AFDSTNSAIFKLTSLCFTKIKVEAPYPKKDIPQCLRCQSYGHTRTYCSHQPRCVRCGDLHDTSLCLKNRNEPTKCALYGGPHPANYKGCSVHKDIIKTHPVTSSNIQKPSQADFPPLPKINEHTNLPQNTPSLTQSASSNINEQLSSFINDFRLLINPLISLLTTLIDKLINNNGRQ
ncbi:Uncharacterized protein FWK35_00029669, partial [Aphis craccivora]